MAQTTSSPKEKSSTIVTVFRVVAILTAVVIVVQFFLAGMGAFDGVHSGAAARDTSNYDPHKAVGYAIAGLSVILLLLAVVARLGGRVIGIAAALLVLAGPIQPLLANAGEDSAAIWGALHVLVGLAIGALTGVLIRSASAQSS
jgi:Family of unknown function (DUF6220)